MSMLIARTLNFKKFATNVDDMYVRGGRVCKNENGKGQWFLILLLRVESSYTPTCTKAI